MLPIGISSCGKEINESLFQSMQANGLSHFEISVPAEYYSVLNYKEIAALSARFGVNLWSFHLPFSPFNQLDISKKELSKHSIDYYSELIKKATDIGINRFIIHPSGEPITENERNFRLSTSMESLFNLAEVTLAHNAKLLVENLPRSCLGKNSDEIIELTSVHNNLFICFDTNHLLSESSNNFISRVGYKIESLHVSDYDLSDEKHWLPGEGITDWETLYNSIISIGYKGPWLYEVSFNSPSTKPRSRNINCADIFRNANEIFSNNPITIIK